MLTPEVVLTSTRMLADLGDEIAARVSVVEEILRERPDFAAECERNGWDARMIVLGEALVSGLGVDPVLG